MDARPRQRWTGAAALAWVVLLLALVAWPAQTTAPPPVALEEIAWMGTSVSPSGNGSRR